MASNPQAKPPAAPVVQAVEGLKVLLLTLADAGYPLHVLTDQVRKNYVLAALDVTHGNQCRAAELIGVHRNTLPRILKLER